MKFAICNELYEGWSFSEVCRSASAIGYTGLEIAPFTLAPLVTELSATARSEIRRIASDAGLEIIGLHWLLAKTTGFHLNSAERTVREQTARYLCELVRACADLGGTLLVFGSPAARQLPEGVSLEDAEGYAADTIGRITATLEQCQVRFLIEPLSTRETNFILTADDADRLRRRVNHPLVQIHLDVKAMSSESTPIPEILRRHRDHVGHFHANDSNLLGPGMGSVDFVPIFTALREIGYDGWVSVEVFDFTPGPETIARQSLEYMRKTSGVLGD